MYRFILSSVVLPAALLGTAAWADDTYTQQDQPSAVTSSDNTADAFHADNGNSNDNNNVSSDNVTSNETQQETRQYQSAGTAGTTEASASEVNKGYLSNEAVSIKPEVGALNFTDLTGGNSTRAAYGIQLGWNLSSLVAPIYRPLYLGVDTGAVFSHLGDPSANFFGSNNNGSFGTSGANTVLIPADLKLGYALTDNFRISAHGGGNVLWRSIASSINTGSSSLQSGSVWRIYPNVGGDVEFGLGHSAALLLRPDWTITPGNSIFMGTVGVGVAVG